MISKFSICVFIALVSMMPLQETAVETPDTEKAAATEVDQSEAPKNGAEPQTPAVVDKEQQSIEIAEGWKRLGESQIWLNETEKQIMVRGHICGTEGPLEMFACPLHTKEHESIIAVEAKSSEIHTCLLALEFEPGNPVQWQPKYKPAKGPSIKIDVRWNEDGEEKTVDAKTMVLKSDTKKTMETDWVFGGSEIFVDRVDGRKVYYADSGEMICLSNFSTAMMDVPIESSDSAEGLLFRANTEVIPAKDTQVYLIMTPRK